MNYSLKFTLKLPKDSRLANLVCLHYFKHSVSKSDLLKNVLFQFFPLLKDVLSSLALPPTLNSSPTRALPWRAAHQGAVSAPPDPRLPRACSPQSPHLPPGWGTRSCIAETGVQCRGQAFKLSPAAIWATNGVRGCPGLLPAAPAPAAQGARHSQPPASPPALYAHGCA